MNQTELVDIRRVIWGVLGVHFLVEGSILSPLEIQTVPEFVDCFLQVAGLAVAHLSAKGTLFDGFVQVEVRVVHAGLAKL